MKQRRKLTDAMERILVMAQLSGVTPEDLAYIGNRIRREKIRKDKQHEIDSTTQGWSASKVAYRHYKIVDPKGTVYEIKESNQNSYNSKWRLTKLHKLGHKTHTAEYSYSNWSVDQFPKFLLPALSAIVY